MSFEIERDWITAAGLRAVCLIVNGSHRCGYVEVPKEHPLFGVEYGQETEILRDLHTKAMEGPIGKRGILALFCGANKPKPEVVFDVHGSLTFSGGGRGYPVESDGWWFGFDCSHAGDGQMNDRFGGTDPVRDTEYIVSECESLAQQLSVLMPTLAQKASDR